VRFGLVGGNPVYDFQCVGIDHSYCIVQFGRYIQKPAPRTDDRAVRADPLSEVDRACDLVLRQINNANKLAVSPGLAPNGA